MSVAATAAAPAPAPASPLLTGPILPMLVRLALPNMAAMLTLALVTIAETAYVGQLGTASLAGMALVFPIVMLQQTMAGGAMGGAVAAAVARAMGGGDRAKAAALTVHALVIAVVAGVAIAALFLAFGPAIYRLLGGQGPALEAALAYSQIFFLGVPLLWITHLLAAVLRGTGDMRTPSLALLASSALQIVCGGALGLGLAGLPAFGMAGVAAGQGIGSAVSAALLVAHLWSGRAAIRPAIRATPLGATLFGDILRVGLLALVSPLTTVATVLVVTRLIAGIGTEALAGYGIGARLEFMMIPIAFALGVASLAMIGTALGAGDLARARRVAWTAGATAAVLLGAIGLLVAIWPRLWTGLFTTDSAVHASAATYFAWAGPGYALFGVGLVLYFSAQGAGRIFGPVLVGVIRFAVVAGVGWWLAGIAAPAWQVFALVAAGFAISGLGTAAAVALTDWTPAPARTKTAGRTGPAA